MEIVTSIDNQIDDIIRENKIHRFASELQYTSLEERKAILREILQLSPNKKDLQLNDAKTDARNKINKIYDSIGENSLKKKWISLTTSQKQERIKSYIKNSVKDDKLVITLVSKFLSMLEKRTLKQSYVEYDHHKGEIISLNIPPKPEKPTKIKKTSIESDSESE
jgi:predicted transcriptional regulator